jgi:single-strand DNA-binding protein
MNKVMLIGNLGADPELKNVKNSTICNVRLATTEKWTGKDGEKQEKTEWHRVVFFGKSADIVAKYMKKGSKMFVEGRIQYKEYEKDGEKKWSTDIIGDRFEFLDGGKKGDDTSSKSSGGGGDSAQPSDDDMPF